MAEEPKDSNVKSTIEAVTGLVKAVPIYDDALQPAAKQIGKSLETITKVVNIALVPLKGLVWGYERIEEWINNRVSQKLEGIPEENIITPPIEVAGPTIEAMRYTAENSGIRELYANLLATSMNKNTQDMAHPGYVEIIKNLTADEALILKSFVGNDAYPYIDIRSLYANNSYSMRYLCFTKFQRDPSINTTLVPSFMDNLCRLGILEKNTNAHLDTAGMYEPLMEDSMLDNVKKLIIEEGNTVSYKKAYLQLTTYGKQFIINIVKDK
jgi:hypothetical protein